MELDIRLIQESLAALKPHSELVLDHLFQDLLKKHPVIEELFQPSDSKKQRLLMVNVLSHVVEYLNELEHVSDYLIKLGVRNGQLKILPEHFLWISESLITTFAYYLEDHWSSELGAQWTRLCGFISKKIQDGMKLGLNAREPQLIEPVSQPNVKLPSSIALNVEESQLQEMITQLATDLFKHTLEKETEATLMQLAREEVRKVLMKALELEIKALYGTVIGQPKNENVVAPPIQD